MLDRLKRKIARGLVFIAIQVHPAAVGSYTAKLVWNHLKKRKPPLACMKVRLRTRI